MSENAPPDLDFAAGLLFPIGNNMIGNRSPRTSVFLIGNSDRFMIPIGHKDCLDGAVKEAWH